MEETLDRVLADAIGKRDLPVATHGLLATLQRLATARSHNIFNSLGAKLNLNNFNLAIQAAENLIEQLSSAASPNNEAPYIEL